MNNVNNELFLDFKNALFTRLKQLSDSTLISQAEDCPKVTASIKRYVDSIPSETARRGINAMNQGFVDFLFTDETWKSQINEIDDTDAKLVLLGNCIGFYHSNLDVEYMYRPYRTSPTLVSGRMTIHASANPMIWEMSARRILSTRLSEFTISSIKLIPK